MLSEQVAQQVLLYLLIGQDERIAPLSTREYEIIVLCARGLTLAEIAQVLGVPANRVTKQIEHVLDQLKVMDQVEVAMRDVLADSP